MKLNKTKQSIILEDVEILEAGAEGMSIARVDGMVVFVPFVVPGDVVDVKIIKKKKNYAEGRVVAVKKSLRSTHLSLAWHRPLPCCPASPAPEAPLPQDFC